MEYIYFSRPDSNLDGINVHTTRKLAGKQLYYENPIDADVVIGVPDSSISVMEKPLWRTMPTGCWT